MKLASFTVDARAGFGVVIDDGVVDAQRRSGCASLKDWIANGLNGASEMQLSPPDFAFGEVVWRVPIPDPTHIIGIGLNTKSHFEETSVLKGRKSGDYPKFPRLFLRSSASLVPQGAFLVVPHTSDTLDYEGEIALVIGKDCRYVMPGGQASVRSHVIGVTCFNDGSVRGYQRHSDQVTAGKNFVASGAAGPFIVTLDEIPDLESMEMTVAVNGQRRQRLTMSDLIFSFEELLSYVSQPFALAAGDMIATGSPEGIGALTGNYLKPEDEVTITLTSRWAGQTRQHLELRNVVAAEQSSSRPTP